jgi:hypothetical protein
MFNGVALIAAVAFAGWRQRATANRRGPRRPSATDDGDTTNPPPDASAAAESPSRAALSPSE